MILAWASPFNPCDDIVPAYVEVSAQQPNFAYNLMIDFNLGQ